MVVRAVTTDRKGSDDRVKSNEPKLAEAILRLRANTDFKVFVTALADQGEQLVKKMIYAVDDAQLRQTQGRAQEITEILETIQTAPEKLRQRENTP